MLDWANVNVLLSFWGYGNFFTIAGVTFRVGFNMAKELQQS